MVFGFMGSGFVLYKFKPRPRYIMAWKILAITISAVGLLSVVLIGCERMEVVGTSRCSTTCGCDLHLYSPICHEPTDRTFFSPCHAGCQGDAVKNGSLEVGKTCTTRCPPPPPAGGIGGFFRNIQRLVVQGLQHVGVAFYGLSCHRLRSRSYIANALKGLQRVLEHSFCF